MARSPPRSRSAWRPGRPSWRRRPPTPWSSPTRSTTSSRSIPAESFEFSGNDLLNNVYDTLIELDPADLGPLVPGLAESWEVAEDGMTYTFKMREGAKFHSGNPVTRRGRRLVAAARGDPEQDARPSS